MLEMNENIEPVCTICGAPKDTTIPIMDTTGFKGDKPYVIGWLYVCPKIFCFTRASQIRSNLERFTPIDAIVDWFNIQDKDRVTLSNYYKNKRLD